jgi:hypothetical protein
VVSHSMARIWKDHSWRFTSFEVFNIPDSVGHSYLTGFYDKMQTLRFLGQTIIQILRPFSQPFGSRIVQISMFGII